ncbi:flagellar hook-basal body complex protein FliE [Marivita hallyeonensis]|uniref:Flagellar hook-basal body complex protein FliE n=1 Tax=Marivita hallyeonensis TaxID=996342 RepID=A0A1M5UMH0_9RHOB|nr:flagellar hook-basal body complex protein FliE [Marivita hallyeonensis]SHH64058.1 flagellar hook-basal body complex protein FliE [Marivita hallyeonensis]
MDVKSLFATQQYNALKPATKPDPRDAIAESFAKITEDFAQTLRTTEATALNAMSGDADPHALVEALTQSQLAVETAVTVRNRVVEAYQEILRMPV